MPVVHSHSPVAHVKVLQPHFFLILRTKKVIAGHFNLTWRTVALAARSLFSDRATLKSVRSSLSSDRPALSRVRAHVAILATAGVGNEHRGQAEHAHVAGTLESLYTR
jgi:hypothetical protein